MSEQFEDVSRWPVGRYLREVVAVQPDGRVLLFAGAKAFKSMFAYSGRYRLEGESFVTEVDVASLVEWTGAQQIRTCRFVGPKLQFISKWAPSPFDPSRTTWGVIEFEREAQ